MAISPQSTLARRRRDPRAFSLVEIVLALGIVSFAMVSILGMIPVGLSTFRDAMNLSVEASIAQQLAADVQRSDFQNLDTTNYSFDDQGIGVSSNEAIYTAQVGTPQAVSAGDIIRTNASARTVLIKISNRQHPGITNCYPVLIPTSF